MAKAHLNLCCPHCRFRFKVERKYAGRVARCPKAECGGKLRVPEPTPFEDQLRNERPLQSRSRHSQKSPSRKPELRKPPSRAQGATTRRLGVRTWQIATGTVGLLLAVAAILFAPNGDASPQNEASAGVETRGKPTDVAAGPDIFKEKLQPFVSQYCAECHNADDPEAGIDVAAFPTEASLLTGHGHKTWEKILSMLKIEAMPPADMEQPPAELRAELVAWLEDRLFNLDCELVDDPGRVTVRRLNRVEYRNTIRDLLAVDFDPSNDFPSDDVGYGFDNIGDVLSLSPLLMEKYLDAAETITSEALPVLSDSELRTIVEIDRLQSRPKLRAGGGFLGLSSKADVWSDYQAPMAGDYEIDIRAKAQQYGSDPAKMEVRVDGKVVRTFDVTGEMKQQDYIHKMTLAPGRFRIQASFINDKYDAKKGDRNLYIGRFAITRPEDKSKVNEFIIQRPGPGQGRGVRDSAVAVLRPFMTRAFRGPVTDGDVNRYVDIVEMAVDDGEEFDQGIQYAVQAVLVSPGFLFRVETDAQPNDPMVERPVTDYELASRLSYFLWSSMPDEELFQLAERGELRQPDVLKRQVARLLKDSKSRALVDNFAGQWLNLQMLDEMTPDPNVFPDFDVELRNDMQQESLLVFQAIMQDDRSVLDFLDADFTFMNERLARHYGVDGVTGNEFEKVSLNPQQRAGILTHASILTLTSNPERTSPVKRGKWIMENILGDAPPPPPPGVPELEETRKGNPNASLREQLELHRADPSCASCHRTMDVLGFGFENFDATGRWRDIDGDQTIDSSGKLPTGESFSGPTELVRLLKNRRTEFARCLSEKMLTYALGRGLEYYDRCATDAILARLNNNEYRFSELVLGIVTSKPFQKRRGDGERK
jgi:mono/diheme cytochrome c family protein